jgi:hypothetical protein
MDVDKIKEYVDQLYINFTGRKGDPASSNYLVNNINNKTFTLTQAEFFVKFSKEAKAYAQTKQKKDAEDKVTKVYDFVKELFRVYLKNQVPSQDDVKQFADLILDGSSTLQEVEDEIRLMSIAPPK